MKDEIASYLTVKAMLKIKLENLEKVFWPKFYQMVDDGNIEGAKALFEQLPESSLRMRVAALLESYKRNNCENNPFL